MLQIHVGENIRRIRLERKMTQLGLAERSGVSAQQINQIEWGTKGLSVVSLKRIATALNCTTDELLAEDNDGTVHQRASG